VSSLTDVQFPGYSTALDYSAGLERWTSNVGPARWTRAPEMPPACVVGVENLPSCKRDGANPRYTVTLATGTTHITVELRRRC
jgi:hypothetical protein